MHEKWSDFYRAIVYIGAPVFLIPKWSESDNEIFTDFEIGRINPREDCSLPVLVGKIK